jgi:hypothetical protein
MIVTASILYNLVECPHRVSLDAFGSPADRDVINPFVRLLWERGSLFERETIAELQNPFLDLSKASEDDRESIRRRNRLRVSIGPVKSGLAPTDATDSSSAVVAKLMIILFPNINAQPALYHSVPSVFALTTGSAGP